VHIINARYNAVFAERELGGGVGGVKRPVWVASTASD
jgi:hypothetical protein